MKAARTKARTSAKPSPDEATGGILQRQAGGGSATDVRLDWPCRLDGHAVLLLQGRDTLEWLAHGAIHLYA
jgi:hypothetical protein